MKNLFLLSAIIFSALILTTNCQLPISEQILYTKSTSSSSTPLNGSTSGSSGPGWTTQLLGVAGFNSYAYGLAIDPSGNIFSTGYTTGNLDGQTKTGTSDLFVVKYNTGGVKQWTKLLGASGAVTQAYGAALDSSGNIYSTGYTGGNLDGQTKTGTNDLFVVKYDTNGVKQWTRLLGVSGASTVSNAIGFDSSGYIYSTGYTGGNLDGQTKTGTIDLFIVKYDTSGAKQWTALLGVSGASSYAFGIGIDNSGNVYSTGYTNGNLDGQIKTGVNDLFIVKYNSSGVKQWTKLLGVAGGNSYSSRMALQNPGNIYIAGYTDGNLDGQIKTGTTDLFVVKYNTSGVKQWTTLLGAAGADSGANSIAIDSLGYVYPTGYTTGNLDGQIKTGTDDLFVVKYDPSGVKQWTRLLGVSGAVTVSFEAAVDSSNYIYSTGYTGGNLDGKIKTGINDLFVVKYDSTGLKQ